MVDEDPKYRETKKDGELMISAAEMNFLE